jgi:hypothetical protein
MKTLMIKDLALTEELDRSAMAAVHGGRMLGGVRAPLFGFDVRVSDDHSSHDVTTQWLNQKQSAQIAIANGNSFAFADGVDPKSNISLSQFGQNYKG